MPVSRAAKVALLLLCSASTVNPMTPNAIFGAAAMSSVEDQNAPLVHSPITSEAIRRLAIPESWVHALDYHRPIPEPNDITSRAPYRTLIRCFDAVMVVVPAAF